MVYTVKLFQCLCPYKENSQKLISKLTLKDFNYNLVEISNEISSTPLITKILVTYWRDEKIM